MRKAIIQYIYLVQKITNLAAIVFTFFGFFFNTEYKCVYVYNLIYYNILSFNKPLVLTYNTSIVISSIW